MTKACIHTSAPGKLMLLGEYAVLKQYPALVAAISQRVHIRLKPRTDNAIQIDSQLAHHHTTIKQFKKHNKLCIVCRIIEQFLPDLTHGFDLKIDSAFSPNLGLGSSAAVAVACSSALFLWRDQHIKDAAALCQWLTPIVNTSGADIAASIYGGVISYQRHPWQVTNITPQLPIQIVYSGEKKTTQYMVENMHARTRAMPQLVQQIKQLGENSCAGIKALLENKMQDFYQAIDASQHTMHQLQLSTPALQTAAQLLKKFSSMHAIKISGSGGGDCLFGLGTLTPQQQQQYQLLLTQHSDTRDARLLSVELSPQGVCYHDD